jgi:sulfite reductase beta subunit-like hemoprotein|tara:strand:+ start:231 stop:530 length:300 start_codon:yes stop_codon:yes gene_type:complete
MNYLVIGEHKHDSSYSWKEYLVFSSDEELTDKELERKFYMHWVYKFSEDEDDTEDWKEKDHIEFFQENDGDAVVDYILKTEESIPTLEFTDQLILCGGG